MAPALLDDTAPLEAFKGQVDARFSPYMRAFAKDVGGSPAERMENIAPLIKKRFARAKMHQVFALTRNQFDGVLTEVGGDPGWTPMIEENAGMSFVTNDPSAAAVAGTQSSRSTEAERGEGEQTKTTDNTLSKELGARQIKCLLVPQWVFDSIDVVDRQKEILSEGQFSIVSTAWALWLFCVLGKWNVGGAIIRQCARQIAEIYPKLAPIGKQNPRPLLWENVLKYKSELLARKDVLVRSATAAPARCVP